MRLSAEPETETEDLAMEVGCTFSLRPRRRRAAGLSLQGAFPLRGMRCRRRREEGDDIASRLHYWRGRSVNA